MLSDASLLADAGIYLLGAISLAALGLLWQLRERVLTMYTVLCDPSNPSSVVATMTALGRTVADHGERLAVLEDRE